MPKAAVDLDLHDPVTAGEGDQGVPGLVDEHQEPLTYPVPAGSHDQHQCPPTHSQSVMPVSVRPGTDSRVHDPEHPVPSVGSGLTTG